MSGNQSAFINLICHPLKFRFFLFTKLPAAFFSGVRVKNFDENRCEVTVPYKWFSQNPFRSTYFACLSMAAEMSTGLLAMSQIYKRKPAVSMLVVKVDSSYFKKATGKTYFVCEDGLAIKQAMEEAIQSGEGKMLVAKSVGKNKEGEIVAEFFITWSFKAKKEK
jgi:hypothetical protein